MLFESAPASLDGIVLAVVRGIVSQFDHKLVVVDELHHAFDELRSMAGNVGAIVQVHLELADVGIQSFPLVPPELQAVDDEVACFPGSTEDDRQLRAGDFENPQGHKDCRCLGIVIPGPRRFLSSGFSAPGELTHLDFGLGVQRNSEAFLIVCGFAMDMGHVLKDGVGFPDFF